MQTTPIFARIPTPLAVRFNSESVRNRLANQELLRIELAEWLGSFTQTERASTTPTFATNPGF